MPKKPRITVASQDGVDAFPHEIAALLSLLDHPEALVTDESWLSDFISFGLQGDAYTAEKERIWAAIEERFGVDVRPEVSLLKIARAIAAVNRTRQ